MSVCWAIQLISDNKMYFCSIKFIVILLIFAVLKDTSMTEKEKGARGMLYDANHDEELNDEYLNASLL